MVNLEVRRVWFTEKSVISGVYLNGMFHCYGLEPPKREVKPHCIPVGTYSLNIAWSNKFRRLMPHVLSVPSFEGILVHWGNSPENTEGCLLVGQSRHDDYLGTSRAIFDPLFLYLQREQDAGEEMHIHYFEQPEGTPTITEVA